MVSSISDASFGFRTLLPVGITTSARPRIEWRWKAGMRQWQARVRGEAGEQAAQWESDILPAEARFTYPDEDLPSHETLYAEVRGHDGAAWGTWGTASVFRIEPVAPLQHGVVVYDLHYTRQFNPLQAFGHAHLVAVLQGIVNRHRPGLFVNFVEGIGPFNRKDLQPQGHVDQMWFDRFRQPGGWLEECMIRTVPRLEELLELFGDAIHGVVLWDTSLPATSNIASTVAAAENLLPIPCCNETSSLYSQLIMGGPRLPVKVDLRGKFSGSGMIPDTDRQSTGSRKCDAYLWAADSYLATGKCNPTVMGHYLDAWWVKDPRPGGNWQNHTLSNHDYFVAKQGFFWDLHVWDDEAPVDDPGQKPGTDAATLREIMRIANQASGGSQLIHVGGFTPWAFKYTKHGGAGGKHEPVATEWELARVISAYNGYLDADALGLGAMANASFLSHYPLPSGYAPVLTATPGELKEDGLLTPDGRVAERTFLLNYTGDYDSAAWVWNCLSAVWEDEVRGQVPVAWAINPNLADRAAPMFEYLYRTRTAADSFMCGDSGAGYVNPTQLLGERKPSGLPDISRVWARHCSEWYRKFGLRFSGFLINGSAGHMTPEAEAMYLEFSPDGIVNQYGRTDNRLHLVEGKMPAFELEMDLDDLDSAVRAIKERVKQRGTPPHFMVFRQILKSPSYYRDLLGRLTGSDVGLDLVFCDPHTFGMLGRASLGGTNDNQATVLFVAMPPCGVLTERMKGQVALRNDGWNRWEAGGHWLEVELVRPGSGDRLWHGRMELDEGVAPGGCVVFELEVPVPDFAGDYVILADMVRHGKRFSEKRGYGVEHRVTVRRAAAAVSG